MNCILYLVDTGDIDNFKRSLQSIPSHMQKYPIVAYHEDSLSSEIRSQLKDKHPQLDFFQISLEPPRYSEEINKKIPDRFVMDICSFSLGYRSMCRFFSGEVFKHPELDKYEYALRLDTDSTILDLPYDPFDIMVERQAEYGYRVVCNDHPQCYVDYYKHFQRIVQDLGHLYMFPKEEEGLVYYTNFEVMRLASFRSPVYQDVYSGLDETGGFYLHRWGDHIHRYAFIKQFGLKAVHLPFGYKHGDSKFENNEHTLLFFGQA